MPFQNNYANLVSQKSEAHTRLIRDYDGPNPDFDYIVVGSGIGGGTVADARRLVAERHPPAATLLSRSAFAVGSHYVADDAPLAADDDVAIIPPVSGG